MLIDREKRREERRKKERRRERGGGEGQKMRSYENGWYMQSIPIPKQK